jgi:hypothetical protein
MNESNYKGTYPNTISENETDVIYIREDTDVYIKSKEDRSYDFIEDTDKYNKSGIKLVISIPLDL